MIEENVTITGKVRLEGTIAIPNENEDKYTGIVILNNGGIADRNGNLGPSKYDSDLYKNLCETLTKNKFITLRYDKRNIGESECVTKSVGMWDLVDDAVSVIEFLKNHPKVDKVIVLGHSEGCILSTLANKKVNIDGMIHIAGTCSNLMDQIKYQNEIAINEVIHMKGMKGMLTRLISSPQKIKVKQEECFEEVLKSKEDSIKLRGRKMDGITWMREHFEYDVIKDYNHIKCPILAIGAGKDVQADPEDVKKLKDLVKGKNEYVIIENMDHMLKEYNGEKNVTSLMRQYEVGLKKEIHPQLEEAMLNWLKENYK